MTTSAAGAVTPQLRCGIVLRSDEDVCRAYLSAGLPGADWWVAGRAAGQAEDAEVELDEVERLYAAHDMWPAAFS